MAIQMGSGFTIGSSEPIDSRLIMSKEQMLNINPLTQPEKYFCVCSDDSLIYVYDANNVEDPTTGKFRVISGGSVDLSEYQKINDDTLTTDDKTIPGALNELVIKKLNSPEVAGNENDVLTLTADGTLVWAPIPEVDLSGKLNKPEVDGVAGQILVLQDDGSLAYADNVTEYDDTEIRELIDTKLDKPEVEGSVGQVLTVQEDGTNAYQDVPQYDDTEVRELIDTKLNKPEIEGTTGQILVLQDDGSLAYQDNVTEFDDTAIQEELDTKLNKPEVDGVAGQILVLQDDGTLAYADNVTEYDDTELRELIDTKLDKEKVVQNLDTPDTESVLSTEALNTVLNNKIDRTEGSSLVPDTEIDKIHEHINMDTLNKFSENALGELLYDGSLISRGDPDAGDAGAEGDWITNTKIGNLAAGTDVTGLTAIQIWKIATVAYENPTATVSYSQTNTLIENGQTFNLDITVSNVKKGTGEVSKIDLYKNGSLVESLPYISGTTSYSFTQIADVSTDTSIEVRVYDDADKYSKYTKSYDFVNPYYYGCLDNIPVDATGMTKLVEAKGNKTITNTTSSDGQYITFMYDAAYGNLTSILDPSGFECITGFTKIQLTIGGVQYNCYYSTLKQVITNFKYTYKH